MTKKRSDLLEELEKHAYDIASWRVDHIECLMEKAPDDYPEFAAAAEAAASTGGQIMPPIMGAAAFLMADIFYLPNILPVLISVHLQNLRF